MLKQVTGRFGPESFRPGSFWPGSIRPSLVGRFDLLLAEVTYVSL